MPACTGLPTGAPCPRKAKGAECALGFGDDFFCISYMSAQREFRLGSTGSENRVSIDLQSAEPIDEDNQSSLDMGISTTDKVLIQPILSYILFSMQSAPADTIKQAVMGHFTEIQISEAKDMLWTFCGTRIIGDKKSRRDSNFRSVKETHVVDIINALHKLDNANKLPPIVIHAHSLATIPRSHPEELNNISLCDRLNQLEARMIKMQEQVDRNTVDNMVIREEINNKSSYAAIVRGDSTEQQMISTTTKNAAVRINNHNDAAKILKVHGIGTHNVGDSGEKQPTLIQAHDNMESRDSVMDYQKESDGQFKMPSYVLKQ